MKKERQIHIPPKAYSILQELAAKGHQAFVVGGCVRDSVLGRQPEDWDISTSATPREIKDLFKKTVDTGLKHGTVTVVTEGGHFEVTTFRVDGSYGDHRRPDSVTFTQSLERDLSRRDFTMNAIAYHPAFGWMDPFDGLADIENKRIRTVGNADARFGEDALRMLRAVRFSAQLDFQLDGATARSIEENGSLVQNVSQERIRTELTKILTSPHPEKFSLLQDYGLLPFLLPEFQACFTTPQRHPYHVYDVAGHILTTVAHIENTPLLRWVMLLHDIGKPLSRTTDAKGIDHFYGHPAKSVRLAEDIFKRLKFDHDTVSKAIRLIQYHDFRIQANPKAVRKAIHTLGENIFSLLLKVQAADIQGQNPAYKEERLQLLERIKEIHTEIKAKGQCLSLKDLAVNGQDLMDAGVTEGKEIGKTLDHLLEICLEHPEFNSKDILLTHLGKMNAE